MTDALLLLAAAVLSVLGMGWFALAMAGHWRQVNPGATSQPKAARLRALGLAALAGSAISCLLADHVSMAVLVWLMLLASAAFFVGMLLSQAPGTLRLLYPLKHPNRSNQGVEP